MNAIEAPTAVPTPERMAKGDLAEQIETNVELGRARAWRVTQNPMDRYLRRGQLDPDPHVARVLFDCGEGYFGLRWLAGMVPRATSTGLMMVDGGGGSASVEKRTDACKRLIALDAALGEAHVDVLRAVCVDGWSADAWARHRGYLHSGQGMAFLRDALLALARQWGKVERARAA